MNVNFSAWLFFWIILTVGYWASVLAGRLIFATAFPAKYAAGSLYWWLSVWINLSVGYWIVVGAGYLVLYIVLHRLTHQ